ncbi:MAG TPA: sensor histidine kinase [Usitatibacter sp.]|nr:sensor histidine kinase [Usitatibacter sp.]
MPQRPSRKSLFVQVLGWMGAPLVVLWPAAVAGTYFAATAIADATYDQQLREMVHAVGEEARSRVRSLEAAPVQLPVLNAFRDDPVEPYYVQLAVDRGRVLAGDEIMPARAASDKPPDSVIRFREGRLFGQAVRVAYALVPGEPATFLVQVAEPLHRRGELVGNVTEIVMVVILLLLSATFVTLWYGLRHGLSPLTRLRDRVERRDPEDLSPLPDDVPTEIAPLVNTLNRQLERVRANTETQRRFVADAAHQMRTPLAGLKTQAEAALRDESLEDARERLARIEESADRMGRLVTQLLALARADEARSQPTPKEPVELNALLREVSALWADRALAKGLTLGFDEASGAVTVPGSPLLLRELFANLIDNAIRYTPAGGEVEVSVRDHPPIVSVRDTGLGIAAADRELVFDRFYRVLGTGEVGSGLGLAIVKAIADLHGAKVRIEEAEGGHGAVLRVAFPQ